MRITFSAALLAALFITTLAGCAGPQTAVPKVDSAVAAAEAKKQRRLVIESYMEANRRLLDAGYRILTRGIALCEANLSRTLGLQVMTAGGFSSGWKEAAREAYGLSSHVQVTHVVPDSPAALSGVLAGDTLVSVDGWSIPAGDNALGATVEKLSKHLADSQAPITLALERAGAPRTVSIAPAPACDFQLALKQADEKNAYADGKQIVFSTGMMDFFDSEEELAFVLSHELAHNAMGHIKARRANAIVGGVLGLLLDVAAAAGGVNTGGQFTSLGSNAGAGVFSVAFEQEADYVGLYLMALAGYDVSGAPSFWRRMAVQSPQSIQLKVTHPTTPERFVALEQAVSEINNKRASGQPLRPEPKSRESPSSEPSDADRQ